MLEWIRRRWWAPALAVVVLLTIAAWAIWFTPLLTIRHVVVVGAPAGDQSAIVAAADVAPNSTLLRVDVAGISSRVRHVPRVASVSVRRQWPATLVITVTERAAIGVVVAGRQFQEIDSQGVTFGVPGKRPAGLVLVNAGGPARRAAAGALAELPLSVYSRVLTATAQTPDDVTFTLNGGARVVWGSTDQGPAKAAVLVALLAHVKAHVYDVSAPELPTTS